MTYAYVALTVVIEASVIMNFWNNADAFIDFFESTYCDDRFLSDDRISPPIELISKDDVNTR